jgi:hypothetical protein
MLTHLQTIERDTSAIVCMSYCITSQCLLWNQRMLGLGNMNTLEILTISLQIKL